MKLADLRKLAIKQRTRIRFALSNGMECVVTEQGIAQVPVLKTVPDFNLEEEVARAERFQLETPSTDSRKAPRLQSLSREQLAGMAAAGGAETVHHDEHDE